MLVALSASFASIADFFPYGWFSLLIPLMISAITTAGLGVSVIPILRKLKAGQVIQEDGPQAHLKKGRHTNNGGYLFCACCGGDRRHLDRDSTANVLAVSAVTLAYMTIGWIDDWQILRQQSNKGLTPKMKLRAANSDCRSVLSLDVAHSARQSD